jgi:putative transposase
VIDASVIKLTPAVGTVAACRALNTSRAAVYRRRSPQPARPILGPPVPSHRALSEAERTTVLDELRSERFMGESPAQVYATLLDEGTYLASQSTMYRWLAANGEVRERRDQLRHPNYAKPELLATRPNELWSWDITKLFGPQKWTYDYLYVILDVFSRYVFGWMVAHRESAVLAEKLIGDTLAKQGITRGQLTRHETWTRPYLRSRGRGFLDRGGSEHGAHRLDQLLGTEWLGEIGRAPERLGQSSHITGRVCR